VAGAAYTGAVSGIAAARNGAALSQCVLPLYEPGIYACAGCGSLLFDSATKYHAMSGWPSFSQPLAKNAIRYAFDASHHMQRMEACCNVCGGHLGHVFPDGPEPNGLRYCMNSESLVRQDAVDGPNLNSDEKQP
jgi:methionine-R-sulfoxide reductase